MKDLEMDIDSGTFVSVTSDTVYKFSSLSGLENVLNSLSDGNHSGDILFDNHLPIRTPTILELINARELPRNTIIGLPDSAESINVAI